MRRDRLWLIGGALSSVMLLAVGWFLFIQPQYQAAADRQGQADTANDRIAVLQKRLSELRQQNEHLAAYKAKLAQDRSALPTADSISDLLREVQLASDLTGVTVSGVTVGASAKVVAGKAKVNALPISLTVVGPTAKLNPFLDQLQEVQPRALLISSINLAPSGDGKTDRANLTITLQAFYASGSD